MVPVTGNNKVEGALSSSPHLKPLVFNSVTQKRQKHHATFEPDKKVGRRAKVAKFSSAGINYHFRSHVFALLFCLTLEE